MTDEHELFQIARQLRYDLTSMQAKVTELLILLADLDLPDQTRPVCPTCGATFKSRNGLTEHLYHAHDGPEPAHWVEAEAKASL